MKNQVTVKSHPVTGAIVTPNENPGKDGKLRGSFRVDQEVDVLEGGFFKKQRRSDFIQIEMEQAGEIYAGKTFDGKIIRVETREPQYAGHKAKINPSTNETVLVNGAPVYMQDIFTADLSAQDSLIKAAAVKVEEKATFKA